MTLEDWHCGKRREEQRGSLVVKGATESDRAVQSLFHPVYCACPRGICRKATGESFMVVDGCTTTG